MPEEKNFFTGLFDFSFSHLLLRRLVKLLYAIAILSGGITVVAWDRGSLRGHSGCARPA